jgi:hypothetical protein
MTMMQLLNRLWEAGELDEHPAAWFKTPKPKEELYDLEQDPYELNNLADQTALQDTLIFLRNRLDKWIVETGDLGEYLEKELLEKWLPEGEPKTLAALNSVVKDNKIELSHPEPGVSIVWKQAQDSVWSVYTTPLAESKSIQAKAVRIGYADSPILTID